MRKSCFLLLLLLLTILSFAQQKTITGTVTGKLDKTPLSGVSVQTKNQTVVTDANGKFSIEGSVGDNLVLSYIGMKAATIKITSASQVLAVELEEGIKEEDLVVITGYTSQRKVDLIGSVAVVDLKPVKNNSSGNPMQALQGRVAGLYIEKNGNPNGENSRILIRGLNTLGNTDPLYIIDGAPTKNPQIFQSLNPGSIESVQILKDASAASIYGSRASNGVIIVTTKNGSGKVNIQLNSGLTFQSMKPQKLKMLDGEGRGKALWRGAVNDKTDPNKVAPLIYKYDWNGDFDKPVLNKVNIQPFVGGDSSVPVGNTDWQDAVYDRGIVTSTDLTISGGTKSSSLLMNLGYINNSGIMKYTGYERYSGRINAASQLFDGRLKFGMNSEFATSNQTLATTDLGGASTPSLAINLAPTIPVYTKDGRFAGPFGGGYSDRNNPVDMQWLNRWDNTNRTFVFGNAYMELELIKNLTLRTNLGVDYSTSLFKDIQLAFQEGFLGRQVNSLARNTNRFLSLTWSNTANYHYDFGKNKINVLAGVEAIRQNFEEFGAFREGFAQQTKDYFTLNAGTGRSTNFGQATGNRLLSQFGKLGYSYADRYLASVTLRRDGSSRFGENNKYGFFPAANIGWRINNEKFMTGLQQVSNLKLRAGYGEVGNQDIGDFTRVSLFQTNYGTLFNNGVGFPGQWLNTGTAYDLSGANQGTLPSGYVSVQAGNPQLKWESTKELNLGVDFGLLAEKVYGSFDYFFRTTSDILILPPVASAVGEGRRKWINGATKENKGFELVLGYRNQTKHGISYNINGNLSSFRDKITELPAEVRTAYPGNAQKSILGHSELSIFGYKTDGLFQNQAEVDAHATQIGKGIGRIRYVDQNKDGIVNADDRDWLGTLLPKFEYGLRIDLSYKNFDLSMFGSGIAGRHNYVDYVFLNNFLNTRENRAPGVLNAWTPQNTGSKTPALTLVDRNNETRASDYLFKNTSYFKMRNIQLGYNFSQSLIRPLHMSQLRLYLMSENVFWFKNKEYQISDPELPNFNLIPVPTSYTLGVNITFN
ncbi:SusC/RagA family TonB-linked outer membrane protein [Terrimonas alba]|uniref:SusC/RagA family TonB-linked outer membrane protein n=1 Tax=Terrimonas alba TaxID=3349636 RepID=UPI0035F30ABB